VAIKFGMRCPEFADVEVGDEKRALLLFKIFLYPTLDICYSNPRSLSRA
jgi:hypothetical protein